ncbi:hypothetical protein HMPREF3223_02208 [Cutibacterium avidum]|nr:hypothetical protein HMPREF3223_02208 [Cutibacterium avidum]
MVCHPSSALAVWCPQVCFRASASIVKRSGQRRRGVNSAG